MSEDKKPDQLPPGMIPLNPETLNPLVELYLKDFVKYIDREMSQLQKDMEIIKYALTR